MKVDKYFDIQCDLCTFNRSTDFELGLETSIKRLNKQAKAEGWKYDKEKDINICPNCNKQK
mgnify:CR=1 FL=1